MGKEITITKSWNKIFSGNKENGVCGLLGSHSQAYGLLGECQQWEQGLGI